MTFLKSLFGESFKTSFTRELFKHRIAQIDAATLAAHAVTTAEEMPLRRLQATPEAIIVDIIERYASYVRRDVTPDAALDKIEQQRLSFGQGEPPTPPALATYVQYRAAIEKTEGPPMSAEQVAFCLRSAMRLYQLE
jgi:hypothetical protein